VRRTVAPGYLARTTHDSVASACAEYARATWSIVISLAVNRQLWRIICRKTANLFLFASCARLPYTLPRAPWWTGSSLHRRPGGPVRVQHRVWAPSVFCDVEAKCRVVRGRSACLLELFVHLRSPAAPRRRSVHWGSGALHVEPSRSHRRRPHWHVSSGAHQCGPLQQRERLPKCAHQSQHGHWTWSRLRDTVSSFLDLWLLRDQSVSPTDGRSWAS
jgi:hypothetical protein